MKTCYRLRIKRHVDFICSLLRHLQTDSYLSLEGDLSNVDLSLIPGAAYEPTDLLPRNTIAPLLDFVILPVNSDTIDIICRKILPHVGLLHRVIHIQIVSDNHNMFGAYDNFGTGQVYVNSSIGKEFIVSMLDADIIGWYRYEELQNLKS